MAASEPAPSDPSAAPAPSPEAAPAAAKPPAKNGEVKPAVDPLASLQSLWGALPWNATQDTDARDTASAPNPAAEWLTGASAALTGAVQGAMEGGKAAVAAAGDTLRRVDHSALEGGIAHLRDASGQLVNDVRAGVAQLSADAARADATPTAILAQLRDGTREAFELLVDGDSHTNVVENEPAPWHVDALPEAERAYAGALRERMLRLAVDAIYSRAKREQLFLRGKDDGVVFDADKQPQKALAVLEADPNVRRLRAGLVPAKMKEKNFWAVYFWHVRHTRRLLVAHQGKLPKEEEDEAPESPDTMFGKDEKEVEKVADKVERKEGDGTRNWDDEIDAIFDAKHD